MKTCSTGDSVVAGLVPANYTPPNAEGENNVIILMAEVTIQPFIFSIFYWLLVPAHLYYSPTHFVGY